MATTTLKLPENLKERIAPLAEASGKSPHAWMVEAIASQADAAERRNAFYSEATERLTRFEQTRAAYRAEDVHRCFVALATGKKAA
ncbi:MAG TPA: CopG family transcriptional regulator, partial [Luteimonas sp.]|nr:CopG family transcriptional regulator [Luteimonas sp.]